MKIINPDVQFITPIDGATILKRLEQCGRVCYKSEDKICLLYTSPSPRDPKTSRMPSSA